MPARFIVRGQRVAAHTIDLARKLRRNQTAEEQLLWERLRANRLAGCHFRRQQIICGFIVDFYCHRAGLAVEIDGDIHKGRRARDRERDMVLSERNIIVLRFSNEQVRNSLDEVVASILAHLKRATRLEAR